MPEPTRSGGWARWRDLTRILTARNLKIRYKGSALGFFWSLLTPATTIAMYAIFAGILKFAKGQNYLPFLVTGLLVWGFTAGTLNDSLFAIAGNANLVKKVWFPRVILPLTTALANAVNFLLTLAPLLRDMGLDGTFDAIVCGDGVENPKPAPDAVLEVLRRTDVPAAGALVVGDMPVDIEMGRAAGVRTCGVLWGNATREQLAAAGANVIAASMDDIVAAILP